MITGSPHEKRYRCLRQLFMGGYHQDWDVEYQDGDAVLLGFLAESAPGTATALIAELDRLRAQLRPLDEPAALAFLREELGCDYLPSGSVEDWLLRLEQLARNAP